MIRTNVSDNARVMDVEATPVVVQIVAALTVIQGAHILAITEDAQASAIKTLFLISKKSIKWSFRDASLIFEIY